MKKVTVVGGGTGTYTLLTGLKNYHFDISVIVSMMDSGGSTGLLRDQLGVLPPGDLRQCLVALSDTSEIWRKLFLYRFENGDLKGHNFGNIFITALEKISVDYNEVVETTSKLLGTLGKVVPVTLEKSQLCVEYEDGTVIEGEANIDESLIATSRIKKAFSKPEATANSKALDAIRECDYLIIGPGDLYTSLIPNLIVSGISEEIVKSNCRIIYIANLMTKRGQTTGYKVSDHVNDIEKYLGREVDFVLINSGEISEDGRKRYLEKSGDVSVEDDMANNVRVVRKNIISDVKFENNSSDRTFRSLVRHDSYKLAEEIKNIIDKSTNFSDEVNGLFNEFKNLIAS